MKTVRLVLILAGWLCGHSTALATERVALIIGNSAYVHMKPLREPGYNAAKISDVLKKHGFVIFGSGAQSNLTREKMFEVVSAFAQTTREADQAVIYFSGYAIAAAGADYLVPVDAKLLSGAAAPNETIRLDNLAAAIKPTHGHLTVLVDAISTMPLSDKRHAAKLVPMQSNDSVTIRMASETEATSVTREMQWPFTTSLLQQLQSKPDDLLGTTLAGSGEDVATAAAKPTEKDLQRARAHINELDVSQRAALIATATKQGHTPEEELLRLERLGAFDEDTGKSIGKANQGPRASTDSEPTYGQMRVLYATDRKATGRTAAGYTYGGDRGDLVYGACLVSIPIDHRVGALEGPSLTKFEFTQDPSKHVVLMNTEQLSEDAFFSAVATRIESRPGRNAFIFVHGYYVSFEDAARRTAQMAYDLKFDGAPVFFSWPSQASFLRYSTDESNVDFGKTDLTRFVADFVKKSGADNIYLIAHSMGNRALTGALEDLFATDPDVKGKIKEIILAAPDIDADVFKRDIAPKIVGKGVLVTLYASSNDWALYASKLFHGYARAGDTGRGLVLAKGMTTIDASAVDTDLFGHVYFADSSSIIADIFALLTGRSNPSERTDLRPVDVSGGRYWKMSPAAH